MLFNHNVIYTFDLDLHFHSDAKCKGNSKDEGDAKVPKISKIVKAHTPKGTKKQIAFQRATMTPDFCLRGRPVRRISHHVKEGK